MAKFLPRRSLSHFSQLRPQASRASRPSFLNSRSATAVSNQSARTMASKVDSEFMSKMTEEEKKITGRDQPVKGGPTAKAQSHANQPLNSDVVHDITKGEAKVAGSPEPLEGGPTSTAQSILSQSENTASTRNTASNNTNSGVVDGPVVSKINQAEKKLTGEDSPAERGPTARAQQHVGEPITSEVLHDITEGEKSVTGGERVKGGPTSTAQSELSKSRS